MILMKYNLHYNKNNYMHTLYAIKKIKRMYIHGDEDVYRGFPLPSFLVVSALISFCTGPFSSFVWLSFLLVGLLGWGGGALLSLTPNNNFFFFFFYFHCMHFKRCRRYLIVLAFRWAILYTFCCLRFLLIFLIHYVVLEAFMICLVCL